MTDDAAQVRDELADKVLRLEAELADAHRSFETYDRHLARLNERWEIEHRIVGELARENARLRQRPASDVVEKLTRQLLEQSGELAAALHVQATLLRERDAARQALDDADRRAKW